MVHFNVGKVLSREIVETLDDDHMVAEEFEALTGGGIGPVREESYSLEEESRPDEPTPAPVADPASRSCNAPCGASEGIEL